MGLNWTPCIVPVQLITGDLEVIATFYARPLLAFSRFGCHATRAPPFMCNTNKSNAVCGYYF